MDTYVLDELMMQTRRLAAEYHQKTGQVLPVGHELALYDIARLFNFSKPPSQEASIDLIGNGDWDGRLIQVKSRVLFDKERGQRVGQLNFAARWDTVFLLLFDSQYEPFEVYALDREVLELNLNAQKRTSKGPISVTKFKALAKLIWTNDEYIEEEVWENHP